MINIATDPKLGKILVGANGMTLYMFMKDTRITGKAVNIISYCPRRDHTIGVVGGRDAADGEAITLVHVRHHNDVADEARKRGGVDCLL